MRKFTNGLGTIAIGLLTAILALIASRSYPRLLQNRQSGRTNGFCLTAGFGHARQLSRGDMCCYGNGPALPHHSRRRPTASNTAAQPD